MILLTQNPYCILVLYAERACLKPYDGKMLIQQYRNVEYKMAIKTLITIIFVVNLLFLVIFVEGKKDIENSSNGKQFTITISILIKRLRNPWSCNCSILFIDLDEVLSYWDEGVCGPDGNDANWEWCEQTQGSCKESIFTSKCPSGAAKLQEFRKDYELNGCKYFYRAIYVCTGICNYLWYFKGVHFINIKSLVYNIINQFVDYN